MGAVLAVVGSRLLPADEPGLQKAAPYSPAIALASNEGLLAIKRMQLSEGLNVDLVAAEPMLANPVSFCIDERGRFYVAETFRVDAGVTDTRHHMYWLDDDLACRTVEDRVAMYRKHLGKKAEDYGKEHDRVRFIEDRDGDGKADRSTVFADGFNGIADGIGAGVLARGRQVWYTCIPHLWLLADRDGDGKADRRQSLHSGYGVHVAFYGHDLHGLRFGPDGKLYFSIGDRGFNVKTEQRMLAYPDTGAVLRCNPDGSDLEVFATGLRNPQELAFDQFGNLFTCDNNSDSGDKARVVHVVEGGDSGWRTGYQYIEWPVSRGPWNAERLWEPLAQNQPAWIVPPIANLADGPSGLAYYPGVGLPDRYREHFFLADFRGTSAQSGILSFALKPKGATFELVDEHRFLWSVLATDVDFGPDGSLYVLDWVEGWTGPKKGRIYRVSDRSPANAAVLREVRDVLGSDMSGSTAESLARLLSHTDMRVRQAAQFALADRGKGAVAVLTRVAVESGHPLARVHAVWGLGQIARTHGSALEALDPLLADVDAEVRAQAARVLGDCRVAAAYPKLVSRLADESPRARYFAAIGIGKLGRAEAMGPILEMLRDNGDRDPYLRHAGVMALSWLGNVDGLVRASHDPSRSVRLAVLLALRRLGRAEVARLLGDADLDLVAEVARAIHDVPIDEAMPKLALLIDRADIPEPVLHRAINANFRLGQKAHARAIAALAARSDAPESMRVEALRALSDWPQPSGRDRVLGVWRPLPARSPEAARDAMQPAAAELLRRGPDMVSQAAVQAIRHLAIRDAGPLLHEVVADSDRSAQVRIEIVRTLDHLNDPRLPEIAQRLVNDGDAALRTEARRILARLDPARVVTLVEEVLQAGSETSRTTIAERQGSLAILGELDQPDADRVLSQWLDRLLRGQVPVEIQLDLLQASAKRRTTEIQDKLNRYEESRDKDDPLAPYREAIAGGDLKKGEKIFYDKVEVSCLRCHRIDREGGQVGPDLTSIASRQNRQYLLESLVDPNRQIAQGFDTVVLALTSGQIVTGVLREDNGKELHLVTPEGQILLVPKDEVEESRRGASAMPADVTKYLSKAELRDLVEFLASLK
jgi:quinoprotein glucose dehydrogenase